MLSRTFRNNKIQKVKFASPLLTDAQNRNFSSPMELLTSDVGLTTLAIGTLSLAGLIMSYKISKADQYLVRTGMGITDIKINKTGFVLPLIQNHKFISMHTDTYEFILEAKSNEAIEYLLPAVFTVGPKDDDDSRKIYATLIDDHTKQATILGVLEGTTRTLAASMTVAQVFGDRKTFKDKVIDEIEPELNKFGMTIFNANIKELKDSGESKYFSNIMQQKESSVKNESKIAVAEADKLGNVGAKEREATTRQQVALLEATAIRQENDSQKDIEVSNSELSVVSAEALQKANIAEIESRNNSAIREHETMLIVSEKKYQADLVASKAELLPHTIAEAEAIRIRADATLYAKNKEAEGIKAVYVAQSDGIQSLMASFGGDPKTMMQYVMVDKNQYEKIAEANAKAFTGLNPNITMVSTGNTEGSNPVSDIFKMGLPLAISYLNNQMGFENKDVHAPLDKIQEHANIEEVKFTDVQHKNE